METTRRRRHRSRPFVSWTHRGPETRLMVADEPESRPARRRRTAGAILLWKILCRRNNLILWFALFFFFFTKPPYKSEIHEKVRHGGGPK